MEALRYAASEGRARLTVTFITFFVLAIVAALLLFAAYNTQSARGTGSITDFFLLLGGVAGVSAILSLANLGGGETPRYHIQERTESEEEGNDAILMHIEEVLGKDETDITDAEWREVPKIKSSLNLGLADLVNIDPTLALTKLRLDINIELRRIATDAGIDISRRVVGAGTFSLTRELAMKDVLPDYYPQTIQEILSLINSFIHNNESHSRHAANIALAGQQLLENLRAYPRKKDSQSA